MLLFGRALARDCVSSALAPFVDSVRPCPESPVLRFLHASVCPPSPFSSGSREGADHSSPRGELDANWLRNGCMAASIIFMSSCQSNPRERSNRPWPTSLYLAARLGNCSETAPMGDSELPVCRHSRALNLGEQYFRARASAAPGAARHGGGRAVAAVIDDAASDEGEYEYDDQGYGDQ